MRVRIDKREEDLVQNTLKFFIPKWTGDHPWSRARLGLRQRKRGWSVNLEDETTLAVLGAAG